MTWRVKGAPPRPGGDGRAAGFTLIEMLCTLAILGIALGLIVGYKPPWSGGLRLRGAAAELGSALRLARSEAITHNRPSVFELDLGARRYRVGDGPPRQLPIQLNIVLLTIAGEGRDETTGAIRFNPDGSTGGGRISIDDGAHGIDIGIDWLSGRVTVADAH